jgi:hypothetical protein
LKSLCGHINHQRGHQQNLPLMHFWTRTLS